MNGSTPTVEFDYRPPRLQLVGLTTLALCGAVGMIYMACTNDAPVNVKGWRLTPEMGRVFYGVIAAVTSCGATMLVVMVYIAFAWDRRVVITPSTLILPQPSRTGLSRDEIEIALSTIHALELVPFIGRTQLLRIHYADTTIHIPGNMFASKRVFNELCQTLQDAVDRVRTADQV
ncbi:MAG TPA: hypothetical protein VFG20_14440 [Planctomycetaceae bacterium]|jgi:hypothetical protein|nr:hypothetical protein [Planctomycetaceae bacterium]